MMCYSMLLLFFSNDGEKVYNLKFGSYSVITNFRNILLVLGVSFCAVLSGVGWRLMLISSLCVQWRDLSGTSQLGAGAGGVGRQLASTESGEMQLPVTPKLSNLHSVFLAGLLILATGEPTVHPGITWFSLQLEGV